VTRLTEGNGQNQDRELCVLRYDVLVPFAFLFLVLILISLFFLFIYVTICLLSLGFIFFIALSILNVQIVYKTPMNV